jgi:1-aminocyclopropane-1-carboxylate deaminase
MREIDLQILELPELRAAKIDLKILRLDLYKNPFDNSTASGNKYFKLKYNLSYARAAGFRNVLSFGGIWSNHLHALAEEAAAHGMRSIGIVRSDEHLPTSAMLEDAKRFGMMICPLSSSEYRRRHDPEFMQELSQRFDNAYVIPEGGSNLRGAEGCRDIVAWLSRIVGESYDVVAMPVGSGGTLAGVASALPSGRRAIGYSVVRDSHLPDRVAALLAQLSANQRDNNWLLRDACQTGQYGQCNRELAKFVLDFSARTGIPVEPTYSGKLFYELMRDIEAGYFAEGTRIIAFHTGGMQGWRGQIEKVMQLAA